MEKQIDNTVLDQYYKLYDEKNYKTSFYSCPYSIILSDFIEYGIYKYDEEYGRLSNQEEIIRQFSNYISTIKNNENKIKLLPFIITNGMYKELNDKNFFASIKDDIFNDFASINLQINADNIHPYNNQKENFDRLKVDYKNRNFTAIHNFAIRSPIIYNHQYSKFMYFVSEKSFFNEYCETLDKKDTFSFLNLIELLDINQKIKILKKLSNNKTILEINILKQIVNTENNEQNIQNIISAFAENIDIWEEFLHFYLEYPLRSPQLFLPLANVLSILDNDKIDIFIQAIKINQYFDNDSKEALNSCILKIENDEKREYILKHIFSRWEAFIDNYEGFFGSIIVTDVIDAVIVYVRDFLPQGNISKEIEKLIFNIEEINNRWFSNSSEQSNYFYKQLSKLFIYGFCLDKYNLVEFKTIIANILKNSNLLQKEHVYQRKTTTQFFDEYILKEKIV